jgi:hypothetical protein
MNEYFIACILLLSVHSSNFATLIALNYSINKSDKVFSVGSSFSKCVTSHGTQNLLCDKILQYISNKLLMELK